ncbi:MAG: aminopeptidase [bacterium]|nr:aminopeptidase [bacterium]
MAYTPSDTILKKYADVLVNFALGGGKGIKKGEVVRVSSSESAKPLFKAVCNAIVLAGGHVISNYAPDDEQGDKRRAESFTRFFYEHAAPHQISFFPGKYLKGLADQIDHSIYILADANPHALKGVDPKKIMQRGLTLKPYKDWLNQKEWKSKFTWTIGMYGTPAMAREAGLSEKAYWEQIIKACFLNEKDPIAKWKQVYRDIEKYRSRLNKLSPKIDRLHAVGLDMNLWVKLGEKRAWHAGSGRNIPSFEIFTSPDWRGTEGWIRFNQPLYRYSNKITGIQLWFKNGLVVKSSATTNEKLLKEMIATKGANKIGEYSLTDSRHSRITKFMAETLFDENMGGPYGNTHLALGMSYRDTYSGDVSKLTTKEAERLGFNDSSVHTDIISTTRRTVTAHLKDGSTKIIYKDGRFVL